MKAEIYIPVRLLKGPDSFRNYKAKLPDGRRIQISGNVITWEPEPHAPLEAINNYLFEHGEAEITEL